MAPTTLVTGASRGLGRAIADLLAERGHRVIGLARTVPESFPGRFLPVDLADEQATSETLDALLADTEIDHLVNNAAIAPTGRLAEATSSELHRAVEMNLRLQIQCTQAVVPGMAARGHGRIVNLGSRASRGKVGRTIYGATKAGLEGMTRTWALELAESRITVNCVAPGPTDTEMFAQSQPEGSAERGRILETVPMRRLARPREVASACAYFLEPDAGFVTGQTLYVCGGLTVGLTGG